MSTLTIRTDPEVERALEALTRESLSRSEAARTAILETERAHRRERLRSEAESLRNDPEDAAASRELARDGGHPCVVTSTGSKRPKMPG